MAWDEEGFVNFMDSQRPALTRFARSICLNWADADDAVQECFVRIGLRWTRLSRSGEPIGYARTVLTRLAVDQARRRVRESGRPVEVACGPPEAPPWIEQQAWIEAALAALTPHQRAAVALRYLANRTDAEIAEHLDCSAVTVRSHISRGLATLRSHHHFDPTEA